MRRERAFKRGRWLSLLVAGFIGYLVGDWHAIVVRSAELSASQSIALRFPEPKADTAVAEAAVEMPAATTGTMVLGESRVGLLSPQRMVPDAAPQRVPQIAVQLASAEDVAIPAVPPTASSRRPAAATAQPKSEPKPVAMAAVQPKAESKPAAAGDARHASRPGFVLNDAQIASIKNRLRLSPNQEQMWPAVEAALRNIAYAKALDARRRNAAASTDVASLDPDSAEVQGLKSAAFPLLMSFSDEQRNEVRSLAHVMGLDKLASEL